MAPNYQRALAAVAVVDKMLLDAGYLPESSARQNLEVARSSIATCASEAAPTGAFVWADVRAALLAEINHCAVNGLSMQPEFGQRKGRPGIPAGHIEAVVARFDATGAPRQELSAGQQRALERHKRLVATLPQTREDAEALKAGHREPWMVDLPDGTYGMLPGDPPGPAAVREVRGGIVYDVQPRTGHLLLARKPRGAAACPECHKADGHFEGCARNFVPSAPAAGVKARCPHCDDTGDVTRADGEYLGACTCPMGLKARLADGRRAYCGRCDRGPAEAPSCPHGAHCGLRPPGAAEVHRGS